MILEKQITIVYQAMAFAMQVHRDQKRKYINTPYFSHLAEVAGMVSTIHSLPEAIATAWLHDCIEDCAVTYKTILEYFNYEIAQGVMWLSDVEKGNRTLRKKLSRQRLSNAPGWVQDIKICDLISNAPSIMLYDPKFSVLFLEEKRLLLEVLTKADADLLYIAHNLEHLVKL